MNETANNPGTSAPGQKGMTPPPEILARIQALYNDGLYRQAYELGNSFGPLGDWAGSDACILAGRIVSNLGANRLAFRLHVRAFHSAPESLRTQAYYLEVALAMRGPVLAWEKFQEFRKQIQAKNGAGFNDEGWEYLFSLGARICGHLRDFENAETLLKIAEQNPSNLPWLLVEQSRLLGMKDRWEDSLASCRQALARRASYRPGIHQLAACLHTLDRDDEALQVLQEAAGRIESLPLLSQLASLQMDLEHYAEAFETLERAAAFSPVAEEGIRQWISTQLCRAACALGNAAEATRFAAQLEDNYHRALAVRLQSGAGQFRRVQLSVPFIQQFRLSCVPATLTMLCRYWGIPADHVEVTEAICYDGTPSHRARRWAAANGLATREFTLNWELAVRLLDRQIPFAIYTTETMNGHVQIITGYDEIRRTFIIRNPSFPQIQEAIAESFLKHYAANGPVAMVVVPAGREDRLQDMEFPDAAAYDRLRRIQGLLEEHRRAEAEAEFNDCNANAPGHFLTLTAGRVLHAYDTNTPALSECLDRLLALFPKDGNLLLSKLGMLRETGRREERLEFLRGICSQNGADAVFHDHLARELMADARCDAAARLAARRAVRMQPCNAVILTTLARLSWSARRFDEALELYRFSACVDDTKEPAAANYFSAASGLRQTEPALEFLRRRWQMNSAKSSAPFLTWFSARLQTGKTKEALEDMESVLATRPQDGELWLAAADVFARHGGLDRADQCLAAAEGRVQRAAWLKVKADIARYRTDPQTALAMWREVLRLEPLSIGVHRSLVWVLAETEGRGAALRHLEETCARFPHHYQLNQAWAEWAEGADAKTSERVTRKLVEDHPADVWARRQLALVLCDAAEFDAALAQAEEACRLAPSNPLNLTTRGQVKSNLGQTVEAREDFRGAIRLDVDHAPAIHEFVNSFNTLGERREALKFVETELVRQVVFGGGLRAFRESARLNLEPAVLLASLRVALRERPDLPAAWSVVIQQLADMLELDEALALAQEAGARFPLIEQVWLDLSLVQRLRLDARGEQAALEQAMRVNPASGSAARMLAHYHERAGDWDRARDLLQQACARAPLDAFGHGSLAGLLWQQGERDAAVEKLRHALKIHPGYDWGWQTLGEWAVLIGQPKLAEDLAAQLIQERPGELNSMMVLAHRLAGTGRMPDALRVLEQALDRFPKDEKAHELRAEILAALQRDDEADAACEPPVFGQRPPASLRACRARLEAQRGNVLGAIERMQDVLKDHPGYAAGWQRLADWLWFRKQQAEAIEAMTILRRLAPLSPLPLGYRASMKWQQGDRAGAREDLKRALKYDPDYAFAAINLFEYYLQDKDLGGAAAALKQMRRCVSEETLKTCEVRLHACLLLLPKPPKLPGSQHPQPTREQELDQAFALFIELCFMKISNQEDFNTAVQAMFETGEKQRVDRVLDEAIKKNGCAVPVGEWWMRRRLARGKRFCTREVNRLCPQSEAARRAVVVSIKELAKRPEKTIGRTVVAIYLVLALERFLRRQFRGAALLLLAWRHRSWLHADNDGWAGMGFALVTTRRYRWACHWMRDWRQRSNVRMWMLYNLALALLERRRYKQAVETLEFAMKLPERDQTFPGARLLLALELALEGKTQTAAMHFHELDGHEWTDFLLPRHHLVRALLAIQQAAPKERKKTFHAARQELDRLAAARKDCRVDFRRTVVRMAQDSGSWWIKVSTWLGY